METSIVDFHKRFYIPVIQKLALHLPHVRIIGTRHCSNKCQEKFNSCAAYQDVLCCQDYAEHVLASFAHQIQSEYYGGNKYLYIEGIVLEHLVLQNKEHHCHIFTFANAIVCFSRFYLITENNMQLQQP